MKYEMLATRLLMSVELKQTRKCLSDGTVDVFDYRKEGREILNKILTTVAQVPWCLFPASGSSEKSPPITVHLLAFYMRVCLSEKAMDQFNIEEFCLRATEGIVSDKDVYAIATLAYKEIEDAHSVLRGHATELSNASKGPCMPCTFRLTREGKDGWGAGLQQAAHFGRSEWIAFCLNRLIEGIDGGKLSVTDAILDTDHAGCNSMMHAANDTHSGYCGLSIRMMVAATAYSIVDPHEKEKAVRKILNTFDDAGFSPSLAAASLMNIKALECFRDLGAKLLDSKIKRVSNQVQDMVRTMESQLPMMNPQVGNLVRAIQNGGGTECCNHCGSVPDGKLLACGGCGLAKYCNSSCQKKGWKTHKLVCKTAKQSVVSGDADWFANNIAPPRA